MTILTKRLILIACDVKILDLAIAGNEFLAKKLTVDIAPDWTEFGLSALSYAKEKLLNGPDQTGWWTYFPVHVLDNTLIGSGGFKGPPDSSGEVEIGYEIAPLYRGKGLAAEMASGLITHAFSHPKVMGVTAQTLAGENASVSVLRRCGFAQVDSFNDPDAGLVWKWLLRRNQNRSITTNQYGTQ